MKIISFYSYKGGVGRSQLCSNIAAYLFYHKGKKVLLWDWDFEAPGQHYFFGLKNKDIQKDGTLELLEEYMITMRKGGEIKPSDLTYVTAEKNITPLRSPDSSNTGKTGCIDLLAAGAYENDFGYRANNFDWFEFYSMMDGANYIEHLKAQLETLGYDYILIDSRTGISDYSGICNIQLPAINVLVVAPTLQNFEGCKSIIEKIQKAEYHKIKKTKPRILPILSRLDFSNPHYNEWVLRFAEYFSPVIKQLGEEFDLEFLPEIFSDVYFKDTFLPYTQAISAGENILFSYQRIYTSTDHTKPFRNIAEYIESINSQGSINFYKRLDEDTWLNYADIAIEKGENKKTAIAYTQIGIKQSLTDKKLEYFNKAIEIDSGYPQPYFNGGNSYYVKGDKEKAIEFMQKYAALVPDDELPWFNMGLMHDDLGQKEKAIECYVKAIELKPDYPSALNNLGLLHYQLGQKEKAIDAYYKSIELKPDYHFPWCNLGIVYDSMGQIEKAIDCYKKSIEFNSDFALSWNNLGLIYERTEQKEKAIEYYTKAIELEPENHFPWHDLGRIYASMSQSEKAIYYYNKSIEKKPDFSLSWNNLGVIYYKLGQLENAIECYEKAIKIKSDDYNLWYNLGLSFNKLGETKKAIDSYNKANELNPKDYAVWLELADIYSDLNETEKAEEHYKKSLALNPNSSDVYNNYGFMLLRSKKADQAESLFQKAVALGSNTHGNLNIANINFIKGNWQKAVEHYKKSLENFTEKEQFWTGIDSDFQYLQQYNISKQDFEKMKYDVSQTTVPVG